MVVMYSVNSPDERVKRSKPRQVHSLKEHAVVYNTRERKSFTHVYTHTRNTRTKITQIGLRNPGYYGNYSKEVFACPVVERDEEKNTKYGQAPTLE